MLRVVKFNNGYYGLQNAWTGIILTKNNGEVRTFWTVRGAVRFANKITRHFNKTIRKVI